MPLSAARASASQVEKRLPLQRVGVLKFVEQQVPVARVQLQGQGGRMLLALQQAAGQPFGVGKVDHPLLRLGFLVRPEQRMAEQQAMAVEVPDALVGQMPATFPDAVSNAS